MTVRTSTATALAMINAANGTSYTPADVYFDQVLATTTAEANANGGANTKAFIVPIKKKTQVLADAGVWVYYNRVTLASAMPTNATSIKTTGGYTVEGNTTPILNQFGVNISPADLVPHQIPTSLNADVSVTVTAAANNPAYTGSATVKFNRNAGPSWGSQLTYNFHWSPGRVGYAYAYGTRGDLYFSGPTAPSSIQGNGGTIPPGLSLSTLASSGLARINGTPSSAGNFYNYQATATVGGTTYAAPYSIIVNAAATTGFDNTVTGSGNGVALSTDKYCASSLNVASGQYGKAVGSIQLLNRKTYFEFNLFCSDGDAMDELGIGSSSIAQGNGLRASDDPLAWMILQKTAEFRNNGVRMPGALLSGTFLQNQAALWRDGSTISFAVDGTVKTAVKVWVAINGSWLPDTDNSASNPATNTNPLLTFDATNVSTLVPIWGCAAPQNTSWPQQCQLRTSSLGFTRSAPSGFTAFYSN